MLPDTYGFIFGLALFAAIGLFMVIRPREVAELFERAAKTSNDVFAGANRKTFDPSRRPTNAQTFRLVGAMWLLFVAVAAVLLYVNR